MKGVFHLAGFNYGLSGDDEWRLPVKLPAPGSTFAASLYSSRFINLDAYSPLLRHSWLVARWAGHDTATDDLWGWLTPRSTGSHLRRRYLTPPFQGVSCYITANTGT